MTNTNGGGAWQDYSGNLGYVTQLGAGVMELLDPKDGETILDVGCGPGDHVVQMLAAGAHAFGIDPSPEQIAACRARGLGDDVVGQYSAENLPVTMHDGFDAVFSNAALHYMLDPDLGFKNIAAALKTGGRLVAEMGGTIFEGKISHSNLAVMQNSIDRSFVDMQVMKNGINYGALRIPVRVGKKSKPMDIPYIYHPTVTDLAADLDAVGLTMQMVQIFRRPTPVAISQLPAAVRGYSTNLLQYIPSGYDDNYVQRVTDFLVKELPTVAPSADLPDGGVIMDYIRLRFLAVKTASL